MRISLLAPAAIAATVLLACSEPLSVNTPAEPRFAVAGESGCFTVAFNVVLQPVVGGLFTGTVTGDLEGTLIFNITGAGGLTGATIANFGSAEWTITGGIIPGLASFTTSFENRNLLVITPGSPGTLFENIGRHRATDGVQKANLRYKGTFTVVPAPMADHDYSGVICV